MARTAKYIFVAESPVPVVYLPLAQHPQSRMTLFLATASDAAAFTEPLRRAVRSIDPRQPVYNVRTMREFYQQRGPGTMEIIVVLFASIGLVGLALALVGLYGLMAYMVSRRTREIGIRIAVGASRGQILAMVLRRGAELSLAGIAVGIAGSAAAARLLMAGLPEMKYADAGTFVLAPLAMLVVTVAACAVPARRAAGLDPNKSLREE